MRKHSVRSARVLLLVVCLILGLAPQPAALAQPAPDPGAPGPLATTRQEYSFGNTAFTPPGFPGPVELIGEITAPTDLTAGPFPLLVFLHGRHVTCYDPNTNQIFLEWPCAAGHQSIPSYRGYEYLADVLASNGYIVLSIGANGINARDNSTPDLGMMARAQLMQRHLDIMRDLNTGSGVVQPFGTAPFGTRYVGKVDLQNIGTMGHSRGGEGVVRHFIHNQSLGSPYGIRAVFPLAPTDFSRFVNNNVPLAVLLPYCDGDVSDLQGVHFYDDARYNVPGDLASKHTILVKGANHNFYNTVWTPGGFPAGASDDWRFTADAHCGSGPGNGRLTPARQRGTGLAYISAFLRTYVGAEPFGDLLTGDSPPPPSAQTDQLLVSFHPPDGPSFRRDVNRLVNPTNLTVNTLGGAAVQDGFTPYDMCGGDPPETQFCLPGQSNSRQPHTTPSARAPGKRGLSQLRGGWSSPSAFYRNDLPAGTGDVTGYDKIQFRISVNYIDPRNPVGLPQDFTVLLTDQFGSVSFGLVSDSSTALNFPPGTIAPICPGTSQCPVPKVVLNTVRVPLELFGGVDLANIRSVEFKFDQTDSGAVLISDIAFAGSAVQLAPVSVSTAQKSVATIQRIQHRAGSPFPGAPKPATRRP